MRVSREKAAENREKIVAAASSLFREKGFDGAAVADLMKAAEQRSSRLDRAAIDTVEAAVMLPRLGEVFDAVVISTGNGKNATAPVATVQLLDPAVSARCTGAMEPGTRVKVRLDAADVQRRTVAFSLDGEAPSGSAQGGNPGNQPSIP